MSDFRKKIRRKVTPSAGVILLRMIDGEYHVLLLRIGDYWEFPKGRLEDGENKLEAAMRELFEESGVRDVDFPWGKVFYETFPYGLMAKKVAYFIALTKGDSVRLMPNPNTGEIEHEDYKWVTFADAYEMLGYRLRKVLRWAQSRVLD